MPYTPVGHQRSHTGTLSSHDLIRGSFLPGTTTAASAAYPAANLAVYVPTWIEHPMVVYEVWLETGTLTTSNTVEVGLYTTAGAKVFASADITVTTASDTVNSSSMTDVLVPAGSYYLAFACNSTRNFVGTALAAGLYQAMGCMEQTGLTGSTLPATATFAAYTRAFLPLFGLNFRATAL